jgi:tRNA dimethylallyltransferase
MNSISNSAGNDLPVLPALVGPTATGKTDLALQVADRLNLEIVSCDSRQIYKYMDIGTAKPSEAELQGRPYHLIDYVEPSEIYSAAKYRVDAETVIDQIIARGKMPFIVGGTGLYLRALTRGLFLTPAPDLAYRRELELEEPEQLHELLRSKDPESAAAIPIGNKSRLIRALEVIRLTGKTKSELARSGKYPRQRFLYRLFALTCYRQKLYQKIDSRVDKMIGDGFIEEVESLVRQGYGDSPVLRSTVGYREILMYLEGDLDRSGSIELIAQKTRNYAKRQITWFKQEPETLEIDILGESPAEVLYAEIAKLKLDSQS